MTAPTTELTLGASPLLAPQPPATGRPSPRLDAFAVPLADVAEWTGGWEDLAERALHPAMQSEAAWLGSLLSVEGDGSGAMLFLSCRGDGELVGVTALQRRHLLRDPLPVLRTWSPALMFSGAPLLDKRSGPQALASILQAARARYGARALLFDRVEAVPALGAVFAAAASELDVPFARLDARQCAALAISGSFSEWFERSFPRKRRKEYRRLRARLSETGSLESHIWQESESLDGWIDDFLALERSGWKGRHGTALGCADSSSLSLRTALGALARRRELAFWKLSLDGRPIAMLFAIVGRGRAWLVKIAYEEGLARYSPGVLITLDATECLMRRGDVRLVDSCAVPNHPMIDHLWRDRMDFEDVLIATPGTSVAAFRAILAAERARRFVRRAAKSLYHRILSAKG